MSQIKNQIDAEAKKAADAIRAALVEFNTATGLSVSIDTRWVEVSQLSEPVNRVVLDGVSVRPEHPDVRS